jgi:hypothetical protein
MNAPGRPQNNEREDAEKRCRKGKNVQRDRSKMENGELEQEGNTQRRHFEVFVCMWRHSCLHALIR